MARALNPFPVRWLLLTGIACLPFFSAHRAGAVQPVTSAQSPQVELHVQMGHSGRITDVAFSPDGRWALTGSYDKTARLWDVETGHEIRRFEGHSDVIYAVAFSPNGRSVLTGGEDETARMWDVASARETQRFNGHTSSIHAVAFAPDGRSILTGSSDDTARLWNAETGTETFKLAHRHRVNGVAFSPDGQMAVTGANERVVRLWDLTTGRDIKQFTARSEVKSVAFSTDGRFIVAGMSGSRAFIWDVATGAQTRELEDEDCSQDYVALSSDGRLAATAGICIALNVDDVAPGEIIRVWDLGTHREIHRLRGHTDRILAIAFAPDGRSLLSAGFDQTARMWDVSTGRQVRRFEGIAAGLTSLALAPDGRSILTGTGSGARLWDLASGKQSRQFGESGSGIVYALGATRYGNLGPGLVNAVAFSPDGKLVLTGADDGSARTFETSTGRSAREFTHRLAPQDVWPIRSVAFSPDGGLLIAGSTIWDAKTGQVKRRLNEAGEAAAFSPDGTKLLTSAWSSSHFQLVNVSNGRLVRMFEDPNATFVNTVWSVAFSRDSRSVLGGKVLWDAGSGRELRRFEGHAGVVRASALSPDARTVLTGGADKTARLWDASTGSELHRLEGHTDVVSAVAFSLDGRLAWTAGADGALKLWETASGRLMATLVSFANGGWAVAAPDGRFDADDLTNVRGLYWTAPDDPLKTLPLEIFMRDYYEPGLLARILKGEPLKPIRNLADLNRAQPAVKIVDVVPDTARPDRVRVVVDVASTRAVYAPQGARREVDSGVYDVRLFRDGQLVGYHPAGDGAVTLDDSGKTRMTFPDIRLPANARNVEFSAYAFNRDRVKSANARIEYTPTKPVEPRKGRAYLIGMGVNAHDNPAWNLRYAVNDIRLFLQTFSSRLESAAYAEVIGISLLSDGAAESRATKGDLQTVLSLLAGRTVADDARARVPNADRIRTAEPEDLVLMSFSGHGFAGDAGLFYLVTQDTGPGAGTEVTDDLRARAVSTDDLALWLRDVDAGQMALVVDACYSAASVGHDFKPGPMGSRGLGQLAFDKSMRLLAASQADDVAFESNLLQQGLLSYVLVADGLGTGSADDNPKDQRITLGEWLAYAVTHVPIVAEEIRLGTFKPRGLQRVRPTDGTSTSLSKPGALQLPVLFDFAKRRGDPVVSVIR